MGAEEAVTLVEYRRQGGYPPADDELLRIEDDGAFLLVRTVGGPRVGRFAGALSRQRLTELEKLLGRAVEEDVAPAGLPPHVIETVTTAGTRISVAALTKSSSGGARILRRLRTMSEALTAQPVAALQMEVAPSGQRATVQAIGAEPVHLDADRAELGYDLFGEGEELLTSANHPIRLGWTGRKAVDAGWAAELPLGPEIKLNPKRTLSVRLDLDVIDSDGVMRRARMAVVVGKGWT